jgi:hypothetical protein
MVIGLFVGFLAGLESQTIFKEWSSIGVEFTTASIHTTITMTKDDVPIYYGYHAGSVTNLGKNFTICKLTGLGPTSSGYNLTTYMLNLTSVGIGNMGTLTASSVILPGEWNRTASTLHDLTYNTFNMTTVIHPSGSGLTADCLGVYYEGTSANATASSLWGYDTFSEVTGIDNTFTITLEIIITVS